jgi:hypothetical protein
VVGNPNHTFNKLRVKCLKLQAVTFGESNEFGVFASRSLEPRWLVAVYFGYEIISRKKYDSLPADSSLRNQVETHGLSLGKNGEIIVGLTGAQRNDREIRNSDVCRYGSFINEATGVYNDQRPNCRIVYTTENAYIFITRHVTQGQQLLMHYGSAGKYMH